MIASQRALTYQRQLMTGRWVECRHRALDDGARLSLYRDITEAKAREAELERQSAILSTITANMDGGIVVFDKDNRLVAWRRAPSSRSSPPRAPGHGTGLGLSMVHGFVHQSGGTIRLLSAKGKGTTVQLFLPRAARPVARSAPAGAALPRGTESVLVVEDNADVRAMVVTQVKSLGYRVAEADSGDAAVALLEKRPGEFDLLISDMVMPGETDGLALAKMARERWPKLAILLTTGFSDVVVDESGDGKTVEFAVLRKPYRKADIARAMRAALTVGGA
jgi:CheY-like chemotaxis protein